MAEPPGPPRSHPRPGPRRQLRPLQGRQDGSLVGRREWHLQLGLSVLSGNAVSAHESWWKLRRRPRPSDLQRGRRGRAAPPEFSAMLTDAARTRPGTTHRRARPPRVTARRSWPARLKFGQRARGPARQAVDVRRDREGCTRRRRQGHAGPAQPSPARPIGRVAARPADPRRKVALRGPAGMRDQRSRGPSPAFPTTELLHQSQRHNRILAWESTSSRWVEPRAGGRANAGRAGAAGLPPSGPLVIRRRLPAAVGRSEPRPPAQRCARASDRPDALGRAVGRPRRLPPEARRHAVAAVARSLPGAAATRRAATTAWRAPGDDRAPPLRRRRRVPTPSGRS